jgi:NAD+ kinase
MKLGIVGNLGKKELAGAVSTFLSHLDREGVPYVVEVGVARMLSEHASALNPMTTATEEDCIRSADILVTFGGDGTILSAARLVGQIGTPILGINLGKLGFLAEVAPDEMAEAIRDLLDHRYVVEERSVLHGTSVQMKDRILTAVNDIVIAKGRSSRIIGLNVLVDGRFAVAYRGDGVILSTPTGSTAYALSNGGPIVVPGSRVFGLTPISPHSLSGRPLIVPDNAVVTIQSPPDNEEVLVSADGQEEAIVREPLELEIRRADYPLRLVRRTKRSYFEVLRAKLLWGTDPRSGGDLR